MLVEKSSENTAKDDAAKYDSAKYNERSFSTLIRALRLSQGYFSFILVNCNSLALRQQIVDRLQTNCAVKPRQLFLPESTTTLYRTIAAEVDGEQPPALMLLGLESVQAIDRLLISTNLLCSRSEERRVGKGGGS